MTEQTVITYGVKKDCRGKYGIITDISADGKQYHRIYLSYKKPEFAITKAESFMKSIYKDFTDYRGIEHKFTFENKGILS